MQLFSRNKAIVALSLGALALGACGDDVTVPITPVAPITLSITPPSANMNVGEAVNFAVQIVGGPATGGPTITCSSSTATVATVALLGTNTCRVTAVAAGNATITATASTGQSVASSVTVSPAITGLTVTPSAASLQVNQTLTLSPSVQPAGRTATYTYASSSATTASVTAAGVVTAVAPGVATITVTATSGGTSISQAVAITVTALPTGIATLNVTPAALALAIGSTAQIGANATQPTGAPTATITYSSSAATIASVSAAGVVTGNAPGTAIITVTATSAANANFAGSSLSSSVAVTVAAPANVTIANVTQGPVTSSGGPSNTGITFAPNTQVNQPVDINNTRDQIQVSLNLSPNGQAISAVRVYVCDAAGNNCGLPAAEQTFTGSSANEGVVQLSINTADFTADFATGTSTIKYANGLHVIRASVRTAAGAENFAATNTNAILNFTNVDGWAAQFVTPTRTATRIVGGVAYNYFGGPDAAGAGSIRFVPVFYTAGRTVQSASVRMSNFGATVAYSPTAVTTYGKSATLYTIDGTGWEHPASNPPTDFPIVASAQDNSNNAAPTVSATTGYRTSVTVPAPVAIRLDYRNPVIGGATTTFADGSWFSGVIASPFNFLTGTTGTDNGVGTSTTFNRTITYSGCGVTNGAMPTGTAADIPECATDFTNLVYRINISGTDQLGNAGTGTSNRFAIDNVAPVIRYTAAAAGSGASATPATPGQGPGSALDTTTYTVLANSVFGTDARFLAVPAATDTIFGTDALDERSGLSTAMHYLALANQSLRSGSCVVGTAFTAANGGIGSAFITNPNCTMAAAAIGPTAMADGYRPIVRVLGASVLTEGYYTYRASVVDRAGNTSFTGIRRVLHNSTNPAITGLGIPGTVTAAGPNAFTPNFSEAVEGHFTNFRASYSGLTDGTTDANLLFPAALYNARFNDEIGINGNFTVGTPFTSGINFYTNIEQVDAAGAVVAAPTVSRPDTASARVVNAGGLPSTFFSVALLSANVADDNVTWATANNTLLSWTIGQGISQWNAPATGLKAVVTANPQQVNSPFERVDFYELVSGNWQYLGKVDGKLTPSVSPAGAGPVYIADNGATRVWTYRLTAQEAGVNSLATPALGSLTGRRFIAIGTGGAFTTPTVLKGRALSTNTGVAASTFVP